MRNVDDPAAIGAEILVGKRLVQHTHSLPFPHKANGTGWNKHLSLKCAPVGDDGELQLVRVGWPPDHRLQRGRVAGLRCRGPAPSEPDGILADHPAQASAARYPFRAWCA